MTVTSGGVRKWTLDQAKSLLGAHWCKFNTDFGLTYQSCRFCRADMRNEIGLWKYGVRHYACDDCRRKAIDSRKESAA